MLHDPIAYPEPFSFKPERFLASDGTFRDDPLLTSAFGFGRRLCPARHFVDSSLFIAVSCILAVFDVSPPKDEHGNELPVELKDSGTNSRYRRKGCLVQAFALMRTPSVAAHWASNALSHLEIVARGNL
jgi:hypothetical protein